MKIKQVMKNDINFFKVLHQEIKPAKGTALISEPGLNDPFFKRSVVLLVEHNDKIGTIGFILNKIIDVNISEVMNDFPISSCKPLIMMGGPVNTDSLYFIHTLGDTIPGSMPICNSVYWGGDFDVLKSLFSLGKIKEGQVKFFIGHAGWESGQLLDELNHESWVVVNLNDDDIILNNAQLWRKVVIRLGNKYKTWMNYPENPHLN